MPITRSRKKRTCTRSEKIRNTKLPKKRIVVEHTLAHWKTFRLLGDVSQNAKERYGDLCKSVATTVHRRMAVRALALSRLKGGERLGATVWYSPRGL